MKIGIIRYWVGRPAAEHETVERFKFAAAQVGHHIVELRADGLTLDGRKAEVDFVVNLHFASGKSTDDLTYGALWNPWNFYKAWGLSQTFANQISNDYLISCGSLLVDKRFSGESYPKIISSKLSHTVPDDFLAPKLRSDRKIFYIGVNWEKSTGTKGRHHELLKLLDNANVIEIYGPQKLGGIRPWAGFKNYMGELPFDGKSVYEAASRCGAVLVLSSKDHLEDQIMTSRLFEGIASGASIIGDSHPFLFDHFPNDIHSFDDKKSFALQASEIIEKLTSINSNPEVSLDKILSSQEIVKQNFNLATQLDEIASHAKSILGLKIQSKRRSATAVIVNLSGSLDIKKCFANLRIIGFSRVLLITNSMEKLPSIAGLEAIQSREFNNLSLCIEKYLESKDENEFVTFCTGEEEFLSSYLEFTDSLEGEKLGYIVSGVQIELHEDHYANTSNPLTGAWHTQYLAGLVVKQSALRDFSNYFHSTAIQSLFAYNFHVLRDSNLLDLDHRSGFRVMADVEKLGNMQGSDFHKVVSEINGSVFPTPNLTWLSSVQEQIRLDKSSSNSINDAYQIFRSVYRSLKLPKYLKRLLKAIALRLILK
jgi:hypothetical protein